MLGRRGENLSPEVTELLSPVEMYSSGRELPSLAPHIHRSERFAALPGYRQLQRQVVARRITQEAVDLPFLTVEGIQDTYDGTQGVLENHRRLTPRIQEMLYYSDTHESLMEAIDQACEDDTEQIVRDAEKSGVPLRYDVAILGSGPHGTAAAMELREKFPNLRTVIIDQNPQLGGQWRSYGPNPSFWMNSRVRRADRRLPAIPRTPGSINPLGEFATMELSDVVRNNYATNIELGEVDAINAYLAVDSTLVGVACRDIFALGQGASLRLSRGNSSELFSVKANALLVATGIRQSSALTRLMEPQDTPRLLNTPALYRHFGNAEGKLNHRPLERFHDQRVIAIGGGDSMLTGLEALLGNLPAETYGQYGPGRFRPRSIEWVGAPGRFAEQIDPCLRSRYKNGIVQAVPKDNFDEGAIIRPFDAKAEGFTTTADGVAVTLTTGEILTGDLILDCTNYRPPLTGFGPPIFGASNPRNKLSSIRTIGPGAQLELPEDIREIIIELGIGENTASLWAQMPETNRITAQAGQTAVRNALFGSLGYADTASYRK